MQEVELRAKVTDKEKLQQKLGEVGAQFLDQKEITDYYFGEIRLYEKTGRSFWLRIRVSDQKVELSFKGSTGQDGIYEEHTQVVQDLETILKILRSTGMENPITISKRRESYVLGDISIEIDTFEEQGTFVELEAISGDPSKLLLYQLMYNLDIPKEDIFEIGYITKFLQDQDSDFSKWIVN